MRIIFLSLVVMLVFASCTSEEEKEMQSLMREVTLAGDKVATVSFESLSGHLKGAMSTGGVANAINYCNLNAIPLTDSLSQDFSVEIKRTSTQLRNPLNQPDSLETYMLDLYAQILKMKKPMVGKAILAKTNEVRYFAPIMVKPQCLTCHGFVGQQVPDSTYSLIKDRYPADEAVGYSEGELRGIWSINFGDYESVKKMVATRKIEIQEAD